MIREADANETCGEDGLAFPGSLAGKSQLRLPKLESEIIFSNRVPLVYVKLEYHCRVVCIEVSQYWGIRRHHQMVHGRNVTSGARASCGYVDHSDVQLCFPA